MLIFKEQPLLCDAMSCMSSPNFEGNEAKQGFSRDSFTRISFNSLRRKKLVLWRDLHPEVTKILPKEEQALRESLYEIISTEDTYFHLLQILKCQYMDKITNVISQVDFKRLFRHINDLLQATDKLVTEQHELIKHDESMNGLGQIICRYAEKTRKIYVDYCCHFEGIPALVNKLQDQSKEFRLFAEITVLDQKTECQNLVSLLTLPVQRPTRMILLLKAVLKHLNRREDEYQGFISSYEAYQQTVLECDQRLNEFRELEQMYKIVEKLYFPRTPHVKPLPISLSARKFEREISINMDCFQIMKASIFLFSDLFVLAKTPFRTTYNPKYEVIVCCDPQQVTIRPTMISRMYLEMKCPKYNADEVLSKRIWVTKEEAKYLLEKFNTFHVDQT